MKSRPFDYLKFWRVIRYFYKIKYGLNQADLDMLLFLYSEGYFGKDDFGRFNELLSWDNSRFERLKREGWICVFRIRRGKRKALYELSYKAKRVIGEIYKRLNGEEIPIDDYNNSLIKKDVSYTDILYRNMIIKMNETIRQRPHLSPE